MIKTFRGLIVDGGQDTIVLHTNDGSMGYRIINFAIIPDDPATDASEHIVKIYKISQTTATKDIDFSDNTLLGVAYSTSLANQYQGDYIIIFDREIFNQDIYITHLEANGAKPCNYYIELEQVKLDLSESTVATLKDIRNLS